MENNYCFTRLAKDGEKSWDDILKRFIKEMRSRGCKTKKSDMEWLLLNYYALPNSPALQTAGNKKFYGSACSSFSPIDSLEEGKFSIMNTLKMGVKTTQAGIGTGYSFSNLRSKEEPVRGRVGCTGGPVSFLKSYNGFLREITQATRKSANMGLLSVDHPDIVDFINAKKEDGMIECFNLSVLIDDAFMKAVINDSDYELKYRSMGGSKTVKAREVYDLICKRAWESGEPGVMFSDTIIKDYFEPLDKDKILANPCFSGDMRLLTEDGYMYFSTLEGKDINIYNKDGGISKSKVWCSGEKEVVELTFRKRPSIKCTPDHVWMLNDGTECMAKDCKGKRLKHLKDVDDIQHEVCNIKEIGIEKVYDFTEPKTNWGIVNGYVAHNCSEALLTYGDDFLELCVLGSINLPKYHKEKLHNRKRIVSVLVSILNDIIDVQNYVIPLHEKGMKYRNRKIGVGVAGLATVLATEKIKYSSEEAYKYTKHMFREVGRFSLDASSSLGDGCVGLHRSNASLLSCAPTSTISILFDYVNKEGCSYSLEPYFSLEKQIIKNSYGEFEHQDKIVKFFKGDVKHIECANDLDYKSHLKIVQAYYDANKGMGITQGCSKTINFKENVSVEDIKEALMYCWEKGIKAISFYRQNSRRNQVINIKGNSCQPEERPTRIIYNSAPKRPKELGCEIFHTQCMNKKWIVLVSMHEDYPYEVFAGAEERVEIPKKYDKGIIIKDGNGKYNLHVDGGDSELVLKDIPKLFDNTEHSALTRMVSLSMRHGVSLEFLCEQLLKEGDMFDVNKVIARTLKRFIKDGIDARQFCKNCKSKLIYVAGCLQCEKSCGYSLCG